MDKKERRVFARRCVAAARLRQCFEARFLEHLGKPLSQAKSARQILQSLDLLGMRKQVELYAAARLHKHRHVITQRLQHELQAARDRIDMAVKLILKDHEVFSTKPSDPAMRSTPVPTPANLIDDLTAMEREFAQWKLIEDELVVTTDPIVIRHLDGTIDLGQFEIRLDLDAVEHADKLYRLVALQPKLKKGYIHPHVQEEQLCEGAAQYPILNALDNGLLYDFFLIVRNTLIEYNSNSPYLKLEYWLGNYNDDGAEEDDDHAHCAVCSRHIYDDAIYVCDDCNEEVCSAHGAWCETGEHTICNSCIEYYTEAGLDARGNPRQCCDKVGAAGCHIRENTECWVCAEAPSDKDKVECTLGSQMLCHACAGAIAQGHLATCAGCETAGHAGCALIPLGFPAKQEEGDGTTQDSSEDRQEGQTAVLEVVSTGGEEGGSQTIG